ncbi:MAG: CPBP family glutamic-type intramembrane protease [Sedimentisphaerales bacterium]
MAQKKSDEAEKQKPNGTVLAETGYFARTSRPVYALIFLLPFIITYEILVLLVNPQLLTEPVSNIRGAVVSFVWVQNFLYYVGMDTKSAWLFAPVFVMLTLLILQLFSRQSWKIKFSDLFIMVIECLVLAVPLIVLALVLNRGANAPANSVRLLYDSGSHNMAMNLLTGIGAGIYEELIFRLILISISMMFFETILGVRRMKAIVISVIISSVLFSLHHHFVFLNGQFAVSEKFTVIPFAFRTIAGVFFAVIFAARGFGITAGTHSFYDIIATLINAWLSG